MTALDQAFIKAFSRQVAAPSASAPQPAAPAVSRSPLSRQAPAPHAVEPSPRVDRVAEETTPVDFRAAVASAPTLDLQPHAARGETPICEKRVSLHDVAAAAPSVLPKPRPVAATSGSTLPSLNDVWAALERSPHTSTVAAPSEPEPEIAGETFASGDTAVLCATEQAVISEPWVASDIQWSTAIESWQPIGEPVVTEKTPMPSVEPMLNAVAEAVEAIETPHASEESLSAADLFAKANDYTIPFTPAVSAQSSRAESVAAPREFKPAWQVDHFSWPKLCRRLIARAGDELDRLADAILEVHRQGNRVLGVAGCHRGEGATTLLLCAARRLAERGMKTVLVDADYDRPRLAKRLGLQPQLGWDETDAVGGNPLDEAIIEATANNVALLPIRERPEETGVRPSDPSRLSGCLKTLQDHYDIVLVDLGPLEDAGLEGGTSSRLVGGLVDCVVLVHNRRITTDDQEGAYEQRLAAAGINVAGIIENFVTED